MAQSQLFPWPPIVQVGRFLPQELQNSGEKLMDWKSGATYFKDLQSALQVRMWRPLNATQIRKILSSLLLKPMLPRAAEIHQSLPGMLCKSLNQSDTWPWNALESTAPSLDLLQIRSCIKGSHLRVWDAVEKIHLKQSRCLE